MGGSVNILIPMLAIGVALGGLILTSSRGLRQEMTQMEARLRQDMGHLRDDMTQVEARLQQEMNQTETRLQQEMNQTETRLQQEMSHLRDDMTRLGERVARMEHGQARLEGLLEGLREAISGRTAAS